MRVKMVSNRYETGNEQNKGLFGIRWMERVSTEKNYYLLIISFSLGALYWISDSFLDSLFTGNTFIEELFYPGPYEAFTRSLVALLFVSFSAFAIFLINELKRAEERLSKLNECFLSFGTEPLENINHLVSLCGELMGATAALYNRLDKGMLCSWGQWNTPTGYNPVDKPQGHICYDTINRGSDEVLVVRNLAQTGYARTDPNVIAYNLKTYIGRAIRLGNDYVGSLCVVYQNDFSPGEYDKRFMGVIASAISIEERRRQSEKSFMESELRFRSIVQSANDAIILADSKGRLILWNKGAQAIFGYTEEEMIGKPASFMIPEKYRKKVGLIMSTGKSDFFGKTIESAGYRKDGSEFPLEISIATWNIEKEAYFSVIIRDITERKLTEKALKESEEKYRTLMNDAGDAIILADNEGNMIEVNNKAEELLGYTKEELSKMKISQIHPEEELERTIAAFKVSASLNDGLVLRKDGKTVHVDISGSTIEYGGKKVIQGIFRDVTERKRAEEELRSKQYLLSEAQRIAHIGSWDTNIVTGKMTWSDEMYKIYGVSQETFELTRESFAKLIHPDDQAAMLRWVFAAISGKKEKDLDFRIILPDGTVRFIRSSGEVIFDDKGKPIRMTGTGQDITERKLADEQIKKSLREKEILLREIHHRVKNNMQIISSLLSLQAGYIKDNNYLEMFTDSQNRISTMALVHEKLYRSSDFTKINSKDYIVSIINGIFQSYGDRGGNISMDFKIEDIALGIDSSIPCGLIINELVTNSLKYAFPDGRKGEIKIVFRKINGYEYELVVSDNGIGLPEYLDFRKTKTLGLHLVSMLAEEQLSGTIYLDRSNGTEFKIRFGEEK